MAIVCHIDSVSSVINIPFYRGGTREECLAWKDKMLKALDGHIIGTESQRYTFPKMLLIGDTKATLNQAAL